MTDWHPPRTVAHRETSLAFALRLTDGFTRDRPDGVTVEIHPVDVDPVVNRSGYHVFLDVDADAVTLTVDGGDDYVDERRRVVLAHDADGNDAVDDADGADAADEVPTHVVDDPANPVEIELTPTPAYAFPSSTTTVRGHVEDADGDPVAGAMVTLREFDPVVATTDDGEFALWVPVTAEHVVRRDGRNVVVVDSIGTGGKGGGAALADGDGTDPTLVVDHPDHGETTDPVEVAAGSRTVHYVTLDG
jgi:hypothetical protein